jgi:hypothetical protein
MENLVDEPQSGQWRQKFISIAEEIRRSQGVPAETIVDSPEDPLSIEWEIDDIAFDVTHYPGDDESGILLQCRIGHVPQTEAANIFRQTLKANQLLARTYAGMFAVDSETNQLIYSTMDSLERITNEDLLNAAEAMAQIAKQFQQAHLAHA